MKNKIKGIICMALMVCLTFGLTTTSFAQVRIDKNKSYKAAWKINTYELKLDAKSNIKIPMENCRTSIEIIMTS